MEGGVRSPFFKEFLLLQFNKKAQVFRATDTDTFDDLAFFYRTKNRFMTRTFFINERQSDFEPRDAI